MGGQLLPWGLGFGQFSSRPSYGHIYCTVNVAMLVPLRHTSSELLVGTGRSWPPGWRLVLSWSGLRGAVSFAAALSLPARLPERDLLLTLTFGIVLFTILVQGGTLRPLLER